MLDDAWSVAQDNTDVEGPASGLGRIYALLLDSISQVSEFRPQHLLLNGLRSRPGVAMKVMSMSSNEVAEDRCNVANAAQGKLGAREVD